MKNEILIELVKRWERDAEKIAPKGVAYPDGEDGARMIASHKATQEALRECAETLRVLTAFFPD